MQRCNTLPNSLTISPSNLNLQQCLKIGNSIITLSLFFVMVCILISFGFDEYFSLTAQISAHIGTIIFAAIAKIGYVIRCIGAHGLGHKAY